MASSMIDLVLWVVLPYFSIVIFIMGFIWRYDQNATVLKNKMNPVVTILLLTIIIFNVVFLALYTIINGFNWFSLYVNIIMLHPNQAFLSSASMLLKAQFILTNLIILVIPFTRYMAVIKFPKQLFVNGYQHIKEWTIFPSTLKPNERS